MEGYYSVLLRMFSTVKGYHWIVGGIPSYCGRDTIIKLQGVQ